MLISFYFRHLEDHFGSFAGAQSSRICGAFPRYKRFEPLGSWAVKISALVALVRHLVNQYQLYGISMYGIEVLWACTSRGLAQMAFDRAEGISSELGGGRACFRLVVRGLKRHTSFV